MSRRNRFRPRKKKAGGGEKGAESTLGPDSRAPSDGIVEPHELDELDGNALLIGELLLDPRERVAAVAPRVDRGVVHEVLRLGRVGECERNLDLELSLIHI